MGGHNPIARTLGIAGQKLKGGHKSGSSTSEPQGPVGPEDPPMEFKPAHKQPPDYVAPADDSDMDRLLEALPNLVKAVQQEPEAQGTRGVPASVGLRDEGIVRSAIREMATPEAMAVITNLVRTQAVVVLKQAAKTRELNRPFMQMKWDVLAERMPETMRLIAKTAAVYATTLALGIFLVIWRFAIFGLH